MKKLKDVEPLSDYPSVAIKQALEDLEWIEKSRNHIIDMGTWVNEYDGVDGRWVCSVCQAGAVAIRRGGFDLNDCVALPTVYETPKENNLLQCQIMSFEDLRAGFYLAFLDSWIVSKKDVVDIAARLGEEIPFWTRYEECPQTYKKNMRKVSEIIAEEGY